MPNKRIPCEECRWRAVDSLCEDCPKHAKCKKTKYINAKDRFGEDYTCVQDCLWCRDNRKRREG